MLSQSRRRSRTGQYGKLSAYEPARPSRKRMRSPWRRRASTTSLDLPMPDSPVIEMIAPLPSAIAWHASSSTASSLARPTTSTTARTWAGPRAPVTRAARSGRSTPRSSTSAERLELDAVLHLALGLGPDHDSAVGRELLQPRGDVGGVAERVVAIGALVVVRQHDRAGVDRDAHEQVDAVAAAQLVAVGGDRASGSRAQRALRARRRPRARRERRTARTARRPSIARRCRRSAGPRPRSARRSRRTGTWTARGRAARRSPSSRRRRRTRP